MILKLLIASYFLKDFHPADHTGSGSDHSEDLDPDPKEDPDPDPQPCITRRDAIFSPNVVIVLY